MTDCANFRAEKKKDLADKLEEIAHAIVGAMLILKPTSIITPRVRRAQYELVEALKESLTQSDMTREAAEGRLSALLAKVWNEVEHVAAVTCPTRAKG
ncbi:MAG: hypothetical protein AB1631_10270 [Acidobacteriota bacterium]